ncbi:MAG: hypothetical protein ACD_37C00334G0002 [uncultured bacterium]|nr:MAG: hypothetical protein ACD_37C00334G0002 [uncultured bacterium]
MKKYFKYLQEDKLLSRLFVLAFILIAITVVYILINYSKLPPLLPVFNQLPWGEKRLSQTIGIFIPSGVVFSILIFNIIASSLSYPKSPLISRMLAVTSFLTSLLTLLFVIRTIQLII